MPVTRNHHPYFTIDTFQSVKCAPTAFAGGTTNARGDEGGTNDPYTLFTVTGDVEVRIFGVCTTDLAGATATISVGTVMTPAGLIASTTATDIDTGELWHDATPDANVELLTVAPAKIIVNGADIIESVGTADITSGNIYYVCLWQGLSVGSSVVSAV